MRSSAKLLMTPRSSHNYFSAKDTIDEIAHSRSSFMNNTRCSNVSLMQPDPCSRFEHIPMGSDMFLKKNENAEKKKLKWSKDFRPASTM